MEVIYEEAEVVGKEAKDGFYLVELRLFPDAESSRCAGCAYCFRNHRRIENTVSVICSPDVAEKLSAGSSVRISITIPPIYIPVLLVFGLPLVMLISFGLLAYYYIGEEFVTVLSALCGALIAFILVRTVFSATLKKSERKIEIVELL